MTTTDELARLAADLVAEQEALDTMVALLDDADWGRATPAVGWTVGDQIAHLAYFDETATLAIADPPAFARSVAELADALGERDLDDVTLAPWRARSAREVLAGWREARAALADAARGLDPAGRVAWYGPAMSARSFLSARLMETWAHGTDVADALGEPLVASDRLVHVARLGVRTRAWSYAVRGETPPAGEIRVTLRAPSGVEWSWGLEGDDTLSGPAEEFCLVVTQRRHLDDTSLATGELGRHWLLRAQAFAGGPTLGPPPRATP